jgi:hypothetical protein
MRVEQEARSMGRSDKKHMPDSIRRQDLSIILSYETVQWPCAMQGWAYFKYLEHLDWHSRCKIAGILIEHIEEALPDYISGLHPSQFADHIPELIDALLPTVIDVKGIIGHQSEKKAR